MRGRIATILLVAVALGAAASAGVQLERGGAVETDSELLYLPNGKYLKLLSLGHASLVADAIYLWAIQYYSNYDRVDRYRYVEHVFDNVISELDPHYVDPYWLGALILILEADDVEAGLRLLDKGADRNPQEWILPYLAAWECYRVGRLDQAEDYFARAAAVDGAPPRVRRMQAGMLNRLGNVDDAIALWREVLSDPASDRRSLAIARRQLRQLTVARDLELLSRAIERFRGENGRLPGSLAELTAGSYVDAVPRNPDGGSYAYDPLTGRVASPVGRVLGDG